MLRINAAMISRIENNLKSGRTAEMVAHEIIENTQNDHVKVKIPGSLSATFKRDDDEGRTFKSIYGGYSTVNILNTQADRIQNGEYVGRLRPADDVRVSFGGQAALGALALEHTLMACLESDDVQCNEWSASKIQEAQAAIEAADAAEAEARKKAAAKTKRQAKKDKVAPSDRKLNEVIAKSTLVVTP